MLLKGMNVELRKFNIVCKYSVYIDNLKYIYIIFYIVLYVLYMILIVCMF